MNPNQPLCISRPVFKNTDCETRRLRRFRRSHKEVCSVRCWSASGTMLHACPGAVPSGDVRSPRQRMRFSGSGEFLRRVRSAASAPKPLRIRPSAMPDTFSETTAMSRKVRTYAELQALIHDALRIQHPEWVEPNGDSPICDSYDARLARLLDACTPRENTRTLGTPA
jgi:hypothetical protein